MATEMDKQFESGGNNIADDTRERRTDAKVSEPEMGQTADDLASIERVEKVYRCVHESWQSKQKTRCPLTGMMNHD